MSKQGLNMFLNQGKSQSKMVGRNKKKWLNECLRSKSHIHKISYILAFTTFFIKLLYHFISLWFLL